MILAYPQRICNPFITRLIITRLRWLCGFYAIPHNSRHPDSIGAGKKMLMCHHFFPVMAWRPNLPHIVTNKSISHFPNGRVSNLSSTASIEGDSSTATGWFSLATDNHGNRTPSVTMHFKTTTEPACSSFYTSLFSACIDQDSGQPLGFHRTFSLWEELGNISNTCFKASLSKFLSRAHSLKNSTLANTYPMTTQNCWIVHADSRVRTLTVCYGSPKNEVLE